MQISKEELEQLYGMFTSIADLRDKLKKGGKEDVKMLDEIIKLRAEVEKLKAQQKTNE